MKTQNIELASTVAIEALEPYVDRILSAIAVVCSEPRFTSALVTEEPWLSNFGLTKDDYLRLSQALGVQIEPENDDDWIYRIAAKLREHERRASC